MKRSAPLQRRTPLKRTVAFVRPSVPLPRRVGLQSTTPLRKVSEKRRQERPERDACEVEVLARDPICKFPGCRFASTEVHELQRGQMRALTYLDPEKCIGLCGFLGANHHQWVGEHPQEAHDLGLAKWSWE